MQVPSILVQKLITQQPQSPSRPSDSHPRHQAKKIRKEKIFGSRHAKKRNAGAVNFPAIRNISPTPHLSRVPGDVERIVEREWIERASKVDIGLFLFNGTV